MAYADNLGADFPPSQHPTSEVLAWCEHWASKNWQLSAQEMNLVENCDEDKKSQRHEIFLYSLASWYLLKNTADLYKKKKNVYYFNDVWSSSKSEKYNTGYYSGRIL